MLAALKAAIPSCDAAACPASVPISATPLLLLDHEASAACEVAAFGASSAEGHVPCVAALEPIHFDSMCRAELIAHRDALAELLNGLTYEPLRCVRFSGRISFEMTEAPVLTGDKQTTGGAAHKAAARRAACGWRAISQVRYWGGQVYPITDVTPPFLARENDIHRSSSHSVPQPTLWQWCRRTRSGYVRMCITPSKG